MTKIKRFKQTQKFIVFAGSASFYTTAKAIRNGIGGFIQFNAAAQKALDALEFQRSGTGVDSCAVGLSGTWEGLGIQLNMV